MADWREQYARVKRWQYVMWLGVDRIMFGANAVDTFYAFAQACSHLVDWLENDRKQHVRRQRAEEYVNSNALLAFCRDISNGSKHARLDAKRVKVTSQTARMGSYQMEDDSGQPREQVVEETRILIDYDGQVVDVEVLAGLCVEEWDKFLREEGLLQR